MPSGGSRLGELGRWSVRAPRGVNTRSLDYAARVMRRFARDDRFVEISGELGFETPLYFFCGHAGFAKAADAE